MECKQRGKLPRVTSKSLGIVAGLLLLDAALLLVVGAAMWTAPSSAADEAVGKGLVTLGAALGIPAFLMLCAFLKSWSGGAPADAAAAE